MFKKSLAFSLVVLAFFAIGVGGYALSYYFISHGFLQSKGLLSADDWWQIAFYIHVGSGAIGFMIGWIQFWKRFRQKSITRHRRLGKIYVVAVLVFAAPSGMWLAWHANEGFPAQLGFAGMSAAWFITTLMGYLSIRKKDIARHRVWMIRSYATTLAAVTLRIWLPVFLGAFKLSFHDAYIAVSWSSWVPNLLVAEWLIIGKMKTRYQEPSQSQNTYILNKEN